MLTEPCYIVWAQRIPQHMHDALWKCLRTMILQRSKGYLNELSRLGSLYSVLFLRLSEPVSPMQCAEVPLSISTLASHKEGGLTSQESTVTVLSSKVISDQFIQYLI